MTRAGRTRQCRVDDLLDLLKTEHEFDRSLPFQVIAQRLVAVHGDYVSRCFFISARKPSRRSARAIPNAMLARRKPALRAAVVALAREFEAVEGLRFRQADHGVGELDFAAGAVFLVSRILKIWG